MSVHPNVDYTISEDGILTVTIDLNRCVEIHPRSGNPIIARTNNHKPLWLLRPGEPAEPSGLAWFLYIYAPKQEEERLKNLWPHLWQEIEQRRDEWMLK